MKSIQIKTTLPVLFIVASFIIGTYLYPKFPSEVATHWGINGQVNGYSGKDFGLFFMPILSVFLFGLFLFLPKAEPYKKNFSEFKEYYETFINIVFGFLFYLYLLTLLWNSNINFNMVQFLVPGFAALFYYAGILLEKTKRNWFVGIRTPWTLSDPEVWRKTHRLGAKLFKMVALISLLGIIIPQIAFWLIIVPILLVSGFIFIYSYVEYKK